MTLAVPAEAWPKRLWTYQAERFPVLRHGILIAAFAGSTACVPALLSGKGASPSLPSVLAAIVISFLFFLQLRIADEHKDAEEDARYRPERPVPRGLVHLAELRRIALLAALVQGGLAIALHSALLAPLAVVWAWMALMSVEFFAPRTLRRRPIAYMVTHMAVMALIDMFVVACGWIGVGALPLPGFAPALALVMSLAFVNGTALEIARKSWSPVLEREGVETYSKLWGVKRAGLAIAGVVLVAATLAFALQRTLDAPWFLTVAMLVLATFAFRAALRFRSSPTLAAMRALENSVGLWIIGAYVLSGAAPLMLREFLP